MNLLLFLRKGKYLGNRIKHKNILFNVFMQNLYTKNKSDTEPNKKYSKGILFKGIRISIRTISKEQNSLNAKGKK
jgi:hypothetical protein